MDFKATIDLIIKDLNDASEIIDDLKKCPGVPALQVELAKSKCRSAAEVIALVKNLNFAVPVKDEPVFEQLKQPEPAKPAKSAETVESAESSEPLENNEKTAIIADNFSQPVSVYEEQSGVIKVEKDLSDQLKAKLITSISDSIGISDKFLFMGEIFDGNKEAYALAISKLDKAESLQDARAIIMSYTGEKPESEAVIQLLDLVKIKLSINE
jgi:hypothetical protein